MKIIVLSLVLFSTILHGQDTTYYAKNKQVSTLDSSERFNVGQTDKLSKRYLVQSFAYKNKKIVLESERYFLDNKMEQQEGVSKRFFESGEISEVSFYKNGKLNGRDISYYQSGKIYYEKFYTDGQIDGNSKMYF